MGASIDFKATPYILKKGGTLFAVKVGIGDPARRGLRAPAGRGAGGAGMFAGISTLAVVAAMNDTNGGLYMALMGQYGQAARRRRVHRHVARIRARSSRW